MSKISELSDGGSLVSTDFLIAVRSGGNVKVQMDTINVDQVDLGDNEFIRLGNSQDLTLVHTPTQSIINQAGVGDLLIQKAGSTKLTVNSSGLDVTGSVTTDGLTSAGDVAITGGSSGSTVLTLTTNALADTPLMVFQRTGGAIAGKLAYEDGNTAMAFGTTTAHELKFLTGNTERMQITSAGALQLSDVNSPNDINTAIYSNSDVLEFEAFGTNGAIAFSTGSGVTEAARFDSSQNFLVGGTSTNPTGQNVAGAAIDATGEGNFSVDGAEALRLNRKQDGDIQKLMVAGATVGKFGSLNANRIYFGGADTGIMIASDLDCIYPTNGGDTARSAAISLGNSGTTFKDLYLSGAANVGNWLAFGGAYNYYVHSDNNNYLRFGSGGSEVARFDNSGRLGISNTSPANYTGSASNSLVLGNSSSATGSTGMTIVAGNQATSSIAFSDHAGDGGTSDYRGLFQYVHADDSLRVFTASAERFRIMSGGDARFTLGADAVGTFTDEVGEVGSGNFCFQVANSAQSALKPLGFRAEDIRFATGSLERMRIASDGVVHLNGDVKVLSGDIQMGSGRGINFSASSNAGGMTSETLSDYEEGTFTPTITAATGSLTTVSATGNYTKVGRLVTFAIDITVTNNGTGGGNLRSTLPFTASGINQYGAGRETVQTGFALTGTITGTVAVLVKSSDDTYPATSGDRLQFSGTYIV